MTDQLDDKALAEQLMAQLRAEPDPYNTPERDAEMAGLSLSEFCKRTTIANLDNVEQSIKLGGLKTGLALAYPVQRVGMEQRLAQWLKARFNLVVEVE